MPGCSALERRNARHGQQIGASTPRQRIVANGARPVRGAGGRKGKEGLNLSLEQDNAVVS